MNMRVLIICEHASAEYGGEAILPLHYFRQLRQRNVDVRLIAHSRTREELCALLPDEVDRIFFIEDTRLNRWMWDLRVLLPTQVAHFTLGFVSRLSTQLAARRLAKKLIAIHRIDVVHQPIPVSPRETSVLFGLGVPVVIGPMNGNMSFPPAYEMSSKRLVELWLAINRSISRWMHAVMPGKLRATVLLVANERTRLALPGDSKAEVLVLAENGVDLQLWFPAAKPADNSTAVRFTFVGRLVSLKAVDLLLKALGALSDMPGVRLDILGDGPERTRLEVLTVDLGLQDRVRFFGWLDQAQCARQLRDSDVLVLPSLCECGGAVVLEAMACGIPVVATDWGGPADYLDASCGFLVPPSTRESFVAGLASAMRTLAEDPALRQRLGARGREKVQREFDWTSKVDRMLQIYDHAIVVGPR